MDMPNTQGWALIGLFAMAFFIFSLIAFNPHLAEIQLFGALATVVISGGLGGAIGFFFGSSQGSAKKDETIQAMSQKDGQ
jgi:hypothetical protein